MKAYVTRREIAERFDVSVRTVDNWRECGKLPQPLKLGSQTQSRIRWPIEVIPQLEAALRGAPV